MEKFTPQYAQYLRNLVWQAGQVDCECQVFGAFKHHYQLNPVLPVEVVSAYEVRNQIELPSEYKFFITQVGNGGAGPDYGIYPLRLDQPCWATMETPFLSSRLTKGQWEEKLSPLKEGDVPDDVFDQMEEELMRGVYPLGTKGCTGEMVTVTNGPDVNRIFYIDVDWDGQNMPYDTEMNFLTWYAGFFQEIIAGNDVLGYGFRMIGSEQELMTWFQASTDPKRRDRLLKSFDRFHTVSQEARAFFHRLPEDECARQKLHLLLRYDPEQGIRLFERLLDENPLAAIAESRLVPKEELPRFYEGMRHLLNTIEHGSELIDEVRHYSVHRCLMNSMAECPQMRASHLAAVLKKTDLSEQDIQWSLYYMGKAPDKRTELDTFICAMEQGSDRVAHAALQAVSDVCAEKLRPALWRLWERYQTDDCMRSGLKIAFHTNGLVSPDRNESRGSV